MDVYTKQRQIFFNNLLILEFDISTVEKEYRVKCDKDMFCLPNQKLFEIVIYFLFEKLSEVTEENTKVKRSVSLWQPSTHQCSLKIVHCKGLVMKSRA
ncbi:HAUS6_N domain-containing protein [Caerostris extrusa]|uniref:HAUS6_N domain-containing protein n=1 Tax=Caerostris extrusa TaxID=172846 RepID=A0AAV4QYB0_CAEEX|nr:HAUS6_N domain-containing protein [Caerostris extrusa]